MVRSGRNQPRHDAAGFTLMEMMVSISILLIVILGVGVVFRSVSRAVGISEAAMEMFSNVRAFEHQFETDVGSMDKQGFLVIRGRVIGGRRYDQICFIANGNFPNRTGSPGSNPYADQTTANAAIIWYGHGLVLAGNDAGGKQKDAVPLDAVPGGNTDADFWLCRHTRLLMAATTTDSTVHTSNNTWAAANTSAFWSAGLVTPSALEPPAHISASRVCPVSLTPSQVMEQVALGRQHNPRFEADNLCFRFKVLPNVYASEVQDRNGRPSIINAAFRMHPIMLQGAPEFAVDWTDGSVDAGGNLKWYGVGSPKYPPSWKPGDQLIEPALANGDDYTAIFTAAPCLPWAAGIMYASGEFATYNGVTYRALHASTGLTPGIGSTDWAAVAAPEWPRALRVTYRVTDANNRLEGGRQFVRIVMVQ